MNLRLFFEWWLSQLAEWIPPQFKGTLGAGRDALVFELGRTRTRIYAVVKGKQHEFGAIPVAEVGGRRGALQRFLADLPQHPDRIEVRLPPGRFLQRDLELPLAAADNLQEAVGFQLERLVPFSPSDAIYQCGVIEQDSAARRLRAWVTVTTRDAVDQALELLGEPAPRPARPPRTPPAKDRPMVLAYGFAAGRARHGVAWVLLALNLALLGAAGFLHLNNRQQELATLSTALTEVRQQAAEATELAEDTDRLRAEAVAMRERRTRYPLMVAVLEDLSGRIGDGTWLQRFETREGSLKLHGVSASASTLIGQLEASPLLADVRFEAAVNRDAATGGDRFSITALMANPDAAAAVPPAEAAP